MPMSSIDMPSAHDRTGRRWRIASVAALGGICFFLLYYLTAFHFDTLFRETSRQVDFFVWRNVPNYIFAHGRYPASMTGDWAHTLFPYLPSAALMMLPLSWPPPAIGFALWILIETAAFAVVLWAGLRLSGATALRARWVIAIAATLMCENSLGWDFRNHNNNIVYLALVMLGLVSRSAWLGGFFFALSINLKLYSGLIPIAFAWRRELRLAVVILVLTLLVAAVLPVTVFGLSTCQQLFVDWIAQVHYTLSPTIEARATVSLIRSVATLLTVDPASTTASVVLRSTQIAWLALVVGYYFFFVRNQTLPHRRYYQVRLADVCVALMAPLPISTWFIPYHAVVLLPAYMLLLTVAISDEWPRMLRISAFGACVTSQIVYYSVPGWNYRGIVYLIVFVIVLVGLAAIRRVAIVQQIGQQTEIGFGAATPQSC
jgi:Glycosyltransferase family 87